MAALLAGLLQRKAPKKGLITDLDDTLWSGILAEAGIRNVCWDLDTKAQIHGLYQQFLASLASAGVLIGVASKNDRVLVEKVFAERQDLHLPHQTVFPIEAHWGPKLESVANVLRAWTIGARDAVFVDDSPMEVAEVQADPNVVFNHNWFDIILGGRGPFHARFRVQRMAGRIENDDSGCDFAVSSDRDAISDSKAREVIHDGVIAASQCRSGSIAGGKEEAALTIDRDIVTEDQVAAPPHLMVEDTSV